MAKDLSILVPVYNEENTIESVLDSLVCLKCDKYEIIVVNDGSTDKTDRIISKFISNNSSKMSIRYFNHQTNRGKGAGIKTGLQNAKGQYFTIQDADLEYDPKHIPKLLDKAKKENLDAIYGSRFLGEINNMARANFYANKFYNFLLRIFYRTVITDMHTCYKMVRTDLLRDLNIESEGFNYAPELVSKLLIRKIRIAELPISFNGRNKAAGKKIGIHDGIECTQLLIKYRLENGRGFINILYKERVITTKFLIIGTLGFLCNYLFLSLLTSIGLGRIFAEILAAVVALHLTFVMHDRWTYKNKQTKYKKNLFSRYKRYFLSNSIGSLITVLMFSIFSFFLNHLVSLAIASLIGLVWNYTMNRVLVWRYHRSSEI